MGMCGYGAVWLWGGVAMGSETMGYENAGYEAIGYGRG